MIEETPKIPVFTVIVLSVLCALSLGTGVYYWYTNYFRGADEPTIEAVAEATIIDIAPGIAAAGEPIVEPTPELAPEENLPYEEYEPEELPTPLPLRPVLDPRPQFVELWEYYDTQAIVGHLFIPDTILDTYVTQGEDNYFYLNPSPHGWVFLDYRVDIQLDLDFNVIIYGENDSTLQQILHEYFEYDFFLANPVITFNTQYAEYDWEIFSFYVAPDSFPFAQAHQCYDTWGDVVEMFGLAALYNTRLDVTEYDQVLTLTAPTTTNPDLFYVLQARLMRHITS